MNTRFLPVLLPSCLAVLALPGGLAAGPVSALQAEARDGQVFVTWREAETPPETTFNVYVADRPITAPAGARRVGHHVEAHSARDWWEDPASFAKDKPAGAPVGFLIVPGGQRLDPCGGLFVHTPGKRSLSISTLPSRQAMPGGMKTSP